MTSTVKATATGGGGAAASTTMEATATAAMRTTTEGGEEGFRFITLSFVSIYHLEIPLRLDDVVGGHRPLQVAPLRGEQSLQAVAQGVHVGHQHQPDQQGEADEQAQDEVAVGRDVGGGRVLVRGRRRGGGRGGGGGRVGDWHSGRLRGGEAIKMRQLRQIQILKKSFYNAWFRFCFAIFFRNLAYTIPFSVVPDVPLHVQQHAQQHDPGHGGQEARQVEDDVRHAAQPPPTPGGGRGGRARAEGAVEAGGRAPVLGLHCVQEGTERGGGRWRALSFDWSLLLLLKKLFRNLLRQIEMTKNDFGIGSV